MGGRLLAVAGMPANRTLLELSAGQSDWHYCIMSPNNRGSLTAFSQFLPPVA